MAFLLAFALLAGLVGVPSALASAWLPWSPLASSVQRDEAKGEDPLITEVPADDPAKGLVHRGLSPARKGSSCAGEFEIIGTERCSHGPDAPPPGLDVKVDVKPVAAAAPVPKLRRFDAAAVPADVVVAKDEGSVLAADGSVAVAEAAPAAATARATAFGKATSGVAVAAPAVGPHGVVCEGDGQAGKRVQVLYVYGAGTASRFSQYLASFRTWAAGVDTIYDASARETGGSRHIRYVTTADCQADVREVEVPAGSLNEFRSMINALKTLGYNRADRKYMIFADSNVYCGIGTVTGDDRPGANNRSNAGPSYGRNDSGCWTASVAAHELGHNLGAVNDSAPNSSRAGHCVDEYDVMCYKDAPGTVLRTVCPDRAHEQRLDCNHDDYYSTNPQAGSYLATHWNTANNEFLITGDGGGGPTSSPTPSPSRTTPAPSPTLSPSPSVSPTLSPSPSVSPTSPSPSVTPSPSKPPTGGLAKLTVSETTSTGTRLSWPAAASGGRFGIVVNGRTLGWVERTTVRVTGLRPGTEYRMAIVLRGQGATEPYTDVVAVRTGSTSMPVAGAWFSLNNALTGMAADLYGARSADATPLVLNRSTHAANQIWTLVRAGAGDFLLKSRATGKCVAALGRVAAGVPLVQQACSAKAAGQVFRLKRGAHGLTLSCGRGDLVVGAGNSRFAGQRVLVLQKPTQARHQAWTASSV
jgi:Ricin-type beta-trefoil lectin domain-like/Metallo-peptidase family M12B Reprolysin-like